jgi:hypothetical protein
LFERECRETCPLNYNIKSGECIENCENRVSNGGELWPCREGCSLGFDGICKDECENIELVEDNGKGRCDCIEGYEKRERECVKSDGSISQSNNKENNISWPWWIFLIIGLSVVAVATTLTLLYIYYYHKKKNQEIQENANIEELMENDEKLRENIQGSQTRLWVKKHESDRPLTNESDSRTMGDISLDENLTSDQLKKSSKHHHHTNRKSHKSQRSGKSERSHSQSNRSNSKSSKSRNRSKSNHHSKSRKSRTRDNSYV